MVPGMRSESLRLARIGDVQNGGSLRPVLMADKGVMAVNRDLSASRNLHGGKMADVRRCARRRADIALGRRQNFAHLAPPMEPGGEWPAIELNG